jgi:hypothetical protein
MRRLFILILAAAILVGCAASTPPARPAEQPKAEPAPAKPAAPAITSPYTGLPVTKAQISRRPVVAMIDNSPKARPQAGLDKAQIVYEMLAEGGITRFLAVYLEGEPEVLGPVRSARHYFVYTAAAYDSVYAHCGGSPQAFEEMAAMRIPDLDDIKDRDIYWRSPDRAAPNNLYTSMKVLRDAMAMRSWERQDAPAAQFLFADKPAEGTPATSLRVPYPGGYQGYTISYDYDAQAKAYKRTMAGDPHNDAVTGTQISAHTVIVMYVKSWPIPKDPELRIDMDIVGRGKGVLFSSGKTREMGWVKEGKGSPFQFSEANGEPLKLEPGNIWIQVVPLNAELSVTQ